MGHASVAGQRNVTHYRTLRTAVAETAMRSGSCFITGWGLWGGSRKVTFRGSLNSSESILRLQWALSLVHHCWRGWVSFKSSRLTHKVILSIGCKWVRLLCLGDFPVASGRFSNRFQAMRQGNHFLYRGQEDILVPFLMSRSVFPQDACKITQA